MKTARELTSNDCIRADYSDTISSLIGKFISKNSFEACIFKGEKFAGLFSYSRFLKSRVDIAYMKVSRTIMHCPILMNHHNIFQIATLMFNCNSSILPVIENRFMGVVKVPDVLRNIRQITGLEKVAVKNIRHPKAITVAENDKINKALELMHKFHFDQLPVVDRHGNLSGLINYSDIITNYYYHHHRRDGRLRPRSESKAYRGERPRIPSLPVKDFMGKKEPVMISEEESVFSASEKMAREGVMSFLTEGNKIITKRDILEAVMQTGLPVTKNIQFVGLKLIDADSFTKEWLRKIAAYHSEKIGYFVKGFTTRVQIKEYSWTGKAHKYSIHIMSSSPSGIYTSDSHDWSTRRALHKAFTDLENQIRHDLKVNVKEIPTLRKTDNLY